MKKSLKILFSLGIVAVAFTNAAAIKQKNVDVYTLQISLKVPQVIDNMSSLGKRAYKTQKISGRLLIFYDSQSEAAEAIQLDNLVNKTYKIGGKNVTYKVLEDSYLSIPQIWNAIGSNKTLVFDKSSVCFNAELEPSYAIGEPSNDNSLILVFSGSGSMSTKKLSCGIKYKFPTSISGYVTGTQGCGCHDYGHLSPTRILGVYGATNQDIDIAAVYGTWKAKFSQRIIQK